LSLAKSCSIGIEIRQIIGGGIADFAFTRGQVCAQV
jgi:hypothetical protein